VIIQSGRRAIVVALAALALCGGGAVALHYHRLGLTLSHYDARAHLVVARRIFDSVTPGWQQIGAVWLPLPHLLNALPVQIDFFYRTGLSAVAISVVCFALSAGAIAWIVATITGSLWAGTAGAAIFALNPNVLYLQATPMTEPLLIALTLVSVALLMNWCERANDAADLKVRKVRTTPTATAAGIDARNADLQVRPTAVGLAFALACLTRYEAWPVTGLALVAAAWARWRAGASIRDAIRSVTAIAAYPAVAVAAFFVFSRIVSGAWFANDFFVPENDARGNPYAALAEIVWGVRALSGIWLLLAGLGGLLVLTLTGLADRVRALAAVPLALAATAAVPWAAFIDGHPYRIRYMVPLLAAEAVFAGVAAGVWKRGAWLAIAAVILVGAFELRPLDASAPMVVEAQWDRPNVAARDRVTACLAPHYDGETVMASMGSLGHYMQDLSRDGFRIRDFLHEGNGDIWLNALDNPRPYAGWLLIEEQAEGGDMLAKRSRENPRFLDGFSRVCEAAGVALYRRNPAATGEAARTR
jgi:hypothetical protein